MRIAVFTKKTTFHKGYGGLETQNKILMEGLASRGHDVVLIAPAWELEAGSKNENGVVYNFIECVYRMGPIFGFFGTYQKSNWINRSYEFFKQEHTSKPFDIVLAQSSTGLGVIKKKKELGVKVISIAHGSIISEYKTFINSMKLPGDLFLFIKNTGFALKNFFRRQRDFVHGSDKVITVSTFVKQVLADETYDFDEKFVVIHNGVDTTEFKDTEVKRNGNKFLYIGQVTKSKGMGTLVELCKKAKSENIKFDIDVVGGGEYLETLKKEVAQEECGINVIGKVPYDDVVKNYYLNSDYFAFLLPTNRYEGFPMVNVEAMLAGLPVIAFDIGGNADAIKNNETGYLVRSQDINSFYEKMKYLMQNRQEASKMGDFAKKYALNNFNVETMLDSYEKVINEVLA